MKYIEYERESHKRYIIDLLDGWVGSSNVAVAAGKHRHSHFPTSAVLLHAYLRFHYSFG